MDGQTTEERFNLLNNRLKEKKAELKIINAQRSKVNKEIINLETERDNLLNGAQRSMFEEQIEKMKKLNNSK